MTQVSENPSLDEVMEHFGTKGMRWGVSKEKKTARTQGTIDRLNRVASGNAAKGDMTKTVMGVGRKGLGGVIGVKTAGKHATKLQTKLDQPKKVKPTTAQIKEARLTTDARLGKYMEADRNVRAATTVKGKASAQKVVDKYAKILNETDDARIALKKTKGEKVVAGIMYGASALIVVSALR